VAAQPARAHLDREHRDDHQHDDGGDVGVVELADRLDELVADAAGADIAEHRGLAHVDLEAQDQVARKAGGHLRQHRKADRREPAAARGAHTLHRLHVDVLDQLIEELAGRAHGMEREREHARQRPQPEGLHEDECEDEIGHGAQELEHPPRTAAQPERGRQVRARDEAEHEAHAGAQQRAHIRHDDGLEQQREPVPQVPEPAVVAEQVHPDPLAAVER
jgi:hypothetical protein